eukprot:scaffold16328_cov134-Skeletonema_dohrnii-CCMP3373.AAC.2
MEANGRWMMDENEMKQDQYQNTLACYTQLAHLLCCMRVTLPTSLLICLFDLRCSNCLLPATPKSPDIQRRRVSSDI